MVDLLVALAVLVVTGIVVVANSDTVIVVAVVVSSNVTCPSNSSINESKNASPSKFDRSPVASCSSIK